MTADFIIERLTPRHDRTSFACGVDPLDRYLRQHAGQDERRNLARCFVATLPESDTVVGFYTLAGASVPLDQLSESDQRGLPRYPRVPAALMGRLAVDHRHHGVGLGGAMIIDAGQTALQSDPAFYALFVEAKSEAAAAFYRNQGFRPLSRDRLSLYLPLATIRKAISP